MTQKIKALATRAWQTELGPRNPRFQSWTGAQMCNPSTTLAWGEVMTGESPWRRCEPAGLRACGAAILQAWSIRLSTNKRSFLIRQKSIFLKAVLWPPCMQAHTYHPHTERMRDLKNKNLRTFQFTQDSVKGFIYIGFFFTCSVFPSNTFIGASFTLV